VSLIYEASFYSSYCMGELRDAYIDDPDDSLDDNSHLSTFQNHQHIQLSMLNLRLSYCSLRV
jgi:hypothetical protein